ncbi:MarR family transcriptional regulator [Halorhabdus salina]|uniref:MarR family transcriptional regulator n=1 Tax=Halorhabdus salina TaxID=2750670 RepID=UPI0015EFB5DE|nr:helix-turn-helix domain-containing protein [Halorhabdus salina]
MPIQLHPDDETAGSPPVKPGTNAHELLVVLLEHQDMGFSPKELAELTDVAHSSVHKTLSRMEDRGLVRKVDSYWAVADDIAASEVASVVSLQSIQDAYGDDAYGDDEWVESASDLGENA